MRTVRILLQIIIVLAGALVLAAFIGTNTSWGAIVGVTGFIAFLLAMTFLLKEHTESRTQARPLSPKYLSIILMLLGGFSIFLGVSYFIGREPLPDGSGRCRVDCGLILLAVALLGESVARLLAGITGIFGGIWLCYLGYKINRYDRYGI